MCVCWNQITAFFSHAFQNHAIPLEWVELSCYNTFYCWVSNIAAPWWLTLLLGWSLWPIGLEWQDGLKGALLSLFDWSLSGRVHIGRPGCVWIVKCQLQVCAGPWKSEMRMNLFSLSHCYKCHINSGLLPRHLELILLTKGLVDSFREEGVQLETMQYAQTAVVKM